MNTGLPAIFLHQGGICLRSDPAAVTTVLGSCIAIVLFSPAHSTGAVCHAVMPDYAGGDRGRYVDSALEDMLAGLADRGICQGSLQAKLFGGAHMFAGGYARGVGWSVGGQNIRKARTLIARHNLHLIASDVGGREGRKLVFYPHAGSVWVKKLHRREIV